MLPAQLILQDHVYDTFSTIFDNWLSLGTKATPRPPQKNLWYQDHVYDTISYFKIWFLELQESKKQIAVNSWCLGWINLINYLI